MASLLRRALKTSKARKALHQEMMHSIFVGFSVEKPDSLTGGKKLCTQVGFLDEKAKLWDDPKWIQMGLK